MPKFSKILIFVASLALIVSACGKKGGIHYEGKQGKPKFDRVFDE